MSKKKRVIQVITDGITDKFCKGSRIIATGTSEQLEQYKNQLIENGYKQELSIESREIDGRSTGVRIQGYELVEHNGMLYPKRNVDMAYKAAVKQSQELSNALVCLSALKEEASDEEVSIINETMKVINNKIEQIANKKFRIRMT